MKTLGIALTLALITACTTSKPPATEAAAPDPAASAQPAAATAAPTASGAPAVSGAAAASAAPEPPKTEADCRKCNGKWGPHGKAQIASCSCATRDGGKRCRTSTDCEDRCELPFDTSEPLGGVRCGAAGCTGGAPGATIPDGKCTAYRDPFGCHAWIEPVKSEAGARQVRRICVD